LFVRVLQGELSVYADEWTMLTKSLHPLPDKFHGLTDVSKRYRQRHLDMVVNPEVRQVFRTRARITSAMRRILESKGFVEIETPILNAQPGGAEAKPFETFHNSLDMPLTLRIATELHLKRLIVGGFDRVFEIGRIFRNEGLSPRHNPEFTSVELYQAYADYDDMMVLTETMVADIAKEVTGKFSTYCLVCEVGESGVQYCTHFPIICNR
jgi:lysyl-tRNA synthetase class 2